MLGRQRFLQLGQGGPAVKLTVPTPVVGALSFVAIAAGYDHTCGITTTSDAWCWGANPTGALGNSTNASSTSPARVAGGLLFASIQAGGSELSNSYFDYGIIAESHTCGVTTQSVAYCWGSNNRGELGSATFSAGSLVPVKVSGQP